jgi:hypothetical protein
MKQAQEAAKGAEFGVLGKEFGKSGGRPKKEKPPLAQFCANIKKKSTRKKAVSKSHCK